jgi:TatA/E family protein of Tat protein translocase
MFTPPFPGEKGSQVLVMFGSLGIPEMILIFIVALIVFGPKRLPEIGRTIGKALGEFKKATDDFKSTIEREVRVEELKQIATTATAPMIDTVSRSEPVPSPAPAPTADPAEAPHPKHDPAEPMTAEQMAALSAAPPAHQND